MQDILLSLNSEQKKAVTHGSGPTVVLAGAGSGKTRVLTTRVAWLIQKKNVPPESILLVTFTNKAAKEMDNRVRELTGYSLPYSGTFHSLCSRILRVDGKHIGLQANYSIFDSSDQITLLKQIYKQNNFSTKEHKPSKIKAIISQTKNEMLSPSDYADIANNEFQEFVAKAYKLYQRELHKQNAVDFDDLLILTLKLFNDVKSVLAKYQERFKHVLVDEYQDTNKAQYSLTRQLAAPQNNLYIVGDFSQSIYAWRGADYENLNRLKKDFPNMVSYYLEQNYRSTATILAAATQVIKENTSHPILNLWTDNKDSQKIKIIEAKSDKDEALIIAKIIKNNKGTFNYSDYAILYRTNAQSRPFEEAFIKNGIPYEIIGGTRFYDRKEIKDILSYLKIISNPLDLISLERVQKIGKRRYEKFRQITNNPDEENILLQNPYELLIKIIEKTEYLNKYDENDQEDRVRLENIQELLNVAAQFENIIVFLENIALVENNRLMNNQQLNTGNGVKLMTLHSAKGLEFPFVFMVGVEEGILPHNNSLWDNYKVEEERRLCYVGITRAKAELVITHAQNRWNFGQPSQSIRSRFMSNIHNDIVEEIKIPKQEKNYYSKYNKNESWKKYSRKNVNPTFKPKRRLVVDDDVVEALLNDEIDIDTFLDS